ncbi:protein phosphatase 2C domain-containing protein [Paenibacillus silvisoli]|uniref:protein phosphatase 2C domain-containing protein n=1 Tax=Paenibacillus silvisoli TaxID=3110539 RepID=UPI0028037EFF|nr:protein phosphatase 2C domain-containing protein [Paenibacillus silvisoli]
MNITSASVKGVGAWNEDAIIRNEALQLYGVIDGATSLVPYNGPGGETGGYLAAQLVARTCNEALNADSIMELLVSANDSLRGAMVQAGIDPRHKEGLWTACAAAIRVYPKWIEFAQAGDCMLAVYYADGSIRIVTNDQVAHVDDRTKAVWAEGVAAGLTTRAELLEYCMPTLRNGRELANTDDGYGVINGDPAFPDYAEFGRIGRTNVKALLLFTDGLYIPKLPGESDKESAGEIASLVRQMGLPRYIEWLTELEESDPNCTKYPRGKKSDDKTALWIGL